VDILEALADQAPGQASGKCKIGRWLDESIAGHPHGDQLIGTLMGRDKKAEGYRTIPAVGRVIRRLGLDVCDRTVAEHRRLTCKCFD
jgi:small ligand-binding sensory domain FIST